MGKFVFLFAIFLVVALVQETTAGGECPQSHSVYSCSPKCYSDSDCSYGKLCCENKCNSKSCAEKVTQGTSGYKGSSGGGTGIYCNNVKCSPGEKCGIDRATNRQKCMRA